VVMVISPYRQIQVTQKIHNPSDGEEHAHAPT
jgi:hypothetical protein